MGAAGRIEKPQEMVGKARTRRERGRGGRPGETNPGLDLDHPSSACIIFGHHRRNLHPGRRLVAPGAMHPPLSLSSPGRPGLSRSRKLSRVCLLTRLVSTLPPLACLTVCVAVPIRHRQHSPAGWPSLIPKLNLAWEDAAAAIGLARYAPDDLETRARSACLLLDADVYVPMHCM